MSKTIPISEVRANLPELVDDVDSQFERIIVTKSGKPKAVLMSSDEFESWQETLEILSDPETMKDLREGEKDITEGRLVSQEQLLKELEEN